MNGSIQKVCRKAGRRRTIGSCTTNAELSIDGIIFHVHEVADIPDKHLAELKNMIARFLMDKARDKADIILG